LVPDPSRGSGTAGGAVFFQVIDVAGPGAGGAEAGGVAVAGEDTRFLRIRRAVAVETPDDRRTVGHGILHLGCCTSTSRLTNA